MICPRSPRTIWQAACRIFISPQLFFGRIGRPGAGYAGTDGRADSAGKNSVLAGEKGLVGAELFNGLAHLDSGGIVKVAGLVALGVNTNFAARSKEKSGGIPAVGYIHIHLFTLGIGRG